MTDPKLWQRKSKEAKLTFEQAREAFKYEASTGKLRWASESRLSGKSGTRRGAPGSLAGTVDSRGYLVVRFGGTRYLVHRIVWLLNTGEWPRNLISFINKDKTDTRVENLTSGTFRSIQANRINNTSGHVGVRLDKSQKGWRAYVKIGYVNHHIGVFPTLAEAVEARKAYLTNLGIEP